MLFTNVSVAAVDSVPPLNTISFFVPPDTVEV